MGALAMQEVSSATCALMAMSAAPGSSSPSCGCSSSLCCRLTSDHHLVRGLGSFLVCCSVGHCSSSHCCCPGTARLRVIELYWIHLHRWSSAAIVLSTDAVISS